MSSAAVRYVLEQHPDTIGKSALRHLNAWRCIGYDVNGSMVAVGMGSNPDDALDMAMRPPVWGLGDA